MSNSGNEEHSFIEPQQLCVAEGTVIENCDANFVCASRKLRLQLVLSLTCRVYGRGGGYRQVWRRCSTPMLNFRCEFLL